MRLFIALELPSQLRQSITKLINWLQSQPDFASAGKWVEPQNLHVTLSFLGEVPPKLLPKVTNQLEQIAAQSARFSLKLTRPIGQPAVEPRVILITAEANQSFKLLQENIGQAMKRLNITSLQRPAHLTLIRLKSYLKLPDKTPWQAINLEVAEFSLIQSILTPKGPIYKPLKAFKLTQEATPAKYRPSVAVCLLNPQNEVLLIWRSQNRPNDLGFPQGGINQGEAVEAAARRELMEELGLKQITVLATKDKIYSYRWPKGLIKYGQDINKRGYVGQEQSLVIARIKDLRPPLKPDPIEAAIVRWVPLDKLLATLKPKRRALGRLVMVELDKLGISPNS